MIPGGSANKLLKGVCVSPPAVYGSESTVSALQFKVGATDELCLPSGDHFLRFVYYVCVLLSFVVCKQVTATPVSAYNGCDCYDLDL